MIRWRHICVSTACSAIAACSSGPDGTAPSADMTNGPSPLSPTTDAQPTPTDAGGGPQVLRSTSATVRWRPPTTNTDGSPLTDLRGYEVVYGIDPSDLSREVQVPNPAILSVVIDDLPPGTWYFAARAYNARGFESTLSNVASKTIQ